METEYTAGSEVHVHIAPDIDAPHEGQGDHERKHKKKKKKSSRHVDGDNDVTDEERIKKKKSKKKKKHSKRREGEPESAWDESAATMGSSAGPWESSAGPWESSTSQQWDSSGLTQSTNTSSKRKSKKSSRRTDPSLPQDDAYETAHTGGIRESSLANVMSDVPSMTVPANPNADVEVAFVSQRASQSQPRSAPMQPNAYYDKSNAPGSSAYASTYANAPFTDGYAESMNKRASLAEVPQIAAVGVVAMNGSTLRDPELGKRMSLDSQTSALDRHDDPFAQREGKTLTWRDVNMTLAAKGDEPERKLLQDVWGEVPPKEITAVMGPSGAGKSSLLNILAGRASSHGRLSIGADIRLNNYEVNPTKLSVRKQIAFVAQDDSLQVTSTPREAIRFSARLRLPRATTDSQLDKLTDRMITELGLVSCADTIVGGALIKGISGGERKRTSVGVELVVKPALVFLDEPTSGLDSFSAVQLCQVLKKVANAGASVLFTIHQPSSEIFNSFDHLILMNKGRVMYKGAVANVPNFFSHCGHPVPPNYNPADWIMNVAQSVEIEQLEADGFFPKDDRPFEEPFVEEEGKDSLGITITRRSDKAVDDRPVGMLTEVKMLFAREFRNLTRDTVAIGSRFGITIFLGVLIGIIFLNVAETNRDKISNVQSTFGALIMVLMMSMFGTAQPALLAFPEERPVFLREFSTNHYSVFAYFLSRLAMEAFVTFVQILVMIVITFFMVGFVSSFGMLLVITYALAMASTALAVTLGCAVEDPKLGQEMLPILFVPQMLFAGFFVTPDLIPIWLRWAQYLCSLTYAVRLGLVEEFNGTCGTSLEAVRNCNNLLNNVGANPDDTWWYWIVLGAIFIFFRVGALLILRHKATKFY